MKRLKWLLALAIILLAVASVFAARSYLASHSPSQLLPKEELRKILSTVKVKGSPSAKIHLVEYVDFQCGSCRDSQPLVRKILSEYPNDLLVEFRHFPQPAHSWAGKAAEASECAHDQGRFWEMAEKLFDLQPEWSPHADALSLFKQYARDIGLGAEVFDRCLDSGEKQARVLSDREDGVLDGVSVTPTFILNSRKLVGFQELERLYPTLLPELLREDEKK